MEGKKISVLVAGHAQADSLALIDVLKEGGYDPCPWPVETVEALKAALDDLWDLIISAERLSDCGALEALAIIREKAPRVPVVVVGGAVGEEAAAALIRAGAADFVRRENRQGLLAAVARALEEADRGWRIGQPLAGDEAKFRLLVENAPDAVYVHSDERFVYLNPAAVRLFGAERAEELIGKSFFDRLHPDFRHLGRQRLRTLYEERRPVEVMEQRYLRLDGTALEVEASAVPITYEGRPAALAYVRDITARKEAQERERRGRAIIERLAEELALLAEIGRLIGSTLDIDEVYDRFAAEVKRLIPFDRLVVNIYQPDAGTRQVAYVHGLEISGKEKGAVLPLEGSQGKELMRTRRGLILHPREVKELADSYPALIVNWEAGIRSVMAVPLIARDKVIGALYFHSLTPDAYTNQDLSLAERIGMQIAGAVANAELYKELRLAEASLRESEARFRALFEQAAVGVAEIEMASGRFLSVNKRFCQIVGRTEEEMLASTFLAITHPDDLHVHEEKSALMKSGKLEYYSLEKRYLHKDGRPIWVDITVSPLWKRGEEPGRNMVVVQDITERKKIQEESAQRARQLVTLHEIGVELAAELNLDVLLSSITERALELIGGMTCNCYLYDPEADLLERIVSAGTSQIVAETKRRRGEGFAGHIWATGAPLLVNDYRLWPGRIRDYTITGSLALVGVPVRWGEEFLGVLDVIADHPRQYSQADVEALSLLATQAAIAIRNARLYKTIERVAITDELTGLFNRRGLMDLGEREFERAIRFNRPLAAFMVDIDHFKRINDTHGHAAGDRVLQGLAACFRQNIRGIDIAGRYGGEEFVLLLPETQPSGALQTAERLRQSVASLSIPLPSPGRGLPSPTVRLTASIGVAVWENRVPSLTTLIERADQAQYRAKELGRNKVVAWEG